MTPEQIQQMANQQMLQWLSAIPFWMKAVMVLQFLSILVTVICLPLITWKLYFGNRPAKATSLSTEQIRLQQVRDRRESLQHLSTPIPFVSSGEVSENIDDESRFKPKS